MRTTGPYSDIDLDVDPSRVVVEVEVNTMGRSKQGKDLLMSGGKTLVASDDYVPKGLALVTTDRNATESIGPGEKIVFYDNATIEKLRESRAVHNVALLVNGNQMNARGLLGQVSGTISRCDMFLTGALWGSFILSILAIVLYISWYSAMIRMSYCPGSNSTDTMPPTNPYSADVSPVPIIAVMLVIFATTTGMLFVAIYAGRADTRWLIATVEQFAETRTHPKSNPREFKNSSDILRFERRITGQCLSHSTTK